MLTCSSNLCGCSTTQPLKTRSLDSNVRDEPGKPKTRRSHLDGRQRRVSTFFRDSERRDMGEMTSTK